MRRLNQTSLTGLNRATIVDEIEFRSRIERINNNNNNNRNEETNQSNENSPNGTSSGQLKAQDGNEWRQRFELDLSPASRWSINVVGEDNEENNSQATTKRQSAREENQDELLFGQVTLDERNEEETERFRLIRSSNLRSFNSLERPFSFAHDLIGQGTGSVVERASELGAERSGERLRGSNRTRKSEKLDGDDKIDVEHIITTCNDQVGGIDCEDTEHELESLIEETSSNVSALGHSCALGRVRGPSWPAVSIDPASQSLDYAFSVCGSASNSLDYAQTTSNGASSGTRQRIEFSSALRRETRPNFDQGTKRKGK